MSLPPSSQPTMSRVHDNNHDDDVDPSASDPGAVSFRCFEYLSLRAMQG